MISRIWRIWFLTSVSFVFLTASSLVCRPALADFTTKIQSLKLRMASGQKLCTPDCRELVEMATDETLTVAELTELFHLINAELKVIDHQDAEGNPTESFAQLMDALMVIESQLSDVWVNQVLDEKNTVRPKSSFSSLEAAISELNLNGANENPETLAEDLTRAFYAMRAQGKQEEAKLFENFTAQLNDANSELNLEEDELTDRSIKLTDAKMQNLIRSGDERIRMPLGSLGKAEITSVKNDEDDDSKMAKKLTKVIHAHSERAVLFINAHKIKPDSKHLRKLLSRVLIEGGTTKIKDDGRAGRDILLVLYTPNPKTNTIQIQSVQNYERERIASPEWWKQWWWATVHPITGNVASVGLFWAGLQTYVLYKMDQAHIYIDHHWFGGDLEPIVTAGLAFTFCYGLAIGTLAPTVKHFEYRGTPFMKNVKKWMKSLLFAYPFSLIATDQHFFAFELAALTANFWLWFSVGMNGFGKVHWQGTGEILDAKMRNPEPMKVPVLSKIPWVGPRFFHWNRKVMLYQAIELVIPWPWKMLAFMKVAFAQYGYPLTSLFAIYLKKTLAVRYNHEKKDQFVAEWEATKAMLNTAQLHAWASVEDILMLPLQPAKGIARTTERISIVGRFLNAGFRTQAVKVGAGLMWAGKRIHGDDPEERGIFRSVVGKKVFAEGYQLTRLRNFGAQPLVSEETERSLRPRMNLLDASKVIPRKAWSISKAVGTSICNVVTRYVAFHRSFDQEIYRPPF